MKMINAKEVKILIEAEKKAKDAQNAKDAEVILENMIPELVNGITSSIKTNPYIHS